MSDLIALGLLFEADSAVVAADKLDRLTASAERVEQSTEGMAEGSVRADSAIGAIAEAAERAAERVEGYQRDLRRATGVSVDAGEGFGRLAGEADELGEAFDVAAGSGRGLMGVGQQFIRGLGSQLPMVAALGGVALGVVAAVGTMAAAWRTADEALATTDITAAGLGRTLGMTGDQLYGLAAAAAETGNVGTAEALRLANAYASTGRIGAEQITGLINLHEDYAAFVGTDAAGAQRALAEAMLAPDEAGREMTRTFGLLTQEQLRHIDALVEQGNLTEAQTALIGALDGAMAGHAQRISEVTSLWDAAADAVSRYWNRLGQALHTNTTERIRNLESFYGLEPGEGMSPEDPGYYAYMQSDLPNLRYRQMTDQWMAESARENQAAQNEQDRLDRQSGGPRAAVRRPGARIDTGPSVAERAAEQAARDYERLIETGTRYRDGLIQERNELGLNREERMMRAAQMEADRIATEGNTDASRALASQIMDEARALRDATWAQAARDEQRRQNDTLSMLELERDLIGASNTERARQLAMLRTEIELRNRLGQAFVDSAAGQETIQGAGRVAVYEEGNREAQNAYNDGLTITLDRLRQIEDHASAAAQGLASAFGAPGEALGGMLSVMTRAQTRLEEINDAQRRYVREMGTAGVSSQRMAMFERERGQASVQSWGDMAAAARGFFDEGSTGYRVLMAIEQGYRLMQFAGAIQAMILGQQETASVVAGNVTKAASHGTVAVARSMASLPFPANLGAAAATLAALAALGVMLGGGGRGGGAGRDDVSRAEEATETLRHRFSKGGSGAGGGTDPQGARVVVEFREGPAFGGKVLETVGPVMAEVGQAAAHGGASMALSRAARRGRNKMGLG